MSDVTTVIRPSAVLGATIATEIVRELEMRDVSRGGLWSVTPGLWQRYDKPWDGPSGMSGGSKLVGTIGAVYGSPTKYDITIYRVTVTEWGRVQGWTVDRLCDDALQYVGLTLATCPRITLIPAARDPFHKS